ncbi:exopolysaccharide biosynthesis protein [Cellvibrio sp. ARAG 10.3]|uniref:exopolysaccharide biosynthesis protein n=1 Tax=Cellvibrio sp. ARAG 10.3 TaxID=3451358 RepID=UPI003F46919E
MSLPEPVNVSQPQNLSAVLLAFAANLDRERIQWGELDQLLGDRSFGFLLLLFALPNSIPLVGIPGVSTVTGIVLIVIAIQMIGGLRRLYLPERIQRRSFSGTGFKKLIQRAAPWLAKLERGLKPRWPWLTSSRAERWLGGVCLLLALLLILPIPFGNFFPGFAVVLLALGLIEKDGVFIVAGLAMTVVSVIALGGLVWTIITGALLFIQQLAS